MAGGGVRDTRPAQRIGHHEVSAAHYSKDMPGPKPCERVANKLTDVPGCGHWKAHCLCAVLFRPAGHNSHGLFSFE